MASYDGPGPEHAPAPRVGGMYSLLFLLAMDRQLVSVSLVRGWMFSEIYHKEQPIGRTHFLEFPLEPLQFLERAAYR